MIRLRGKQGGTSRYYFDGNLYYHEKRGSSTIFRCYQRNVTRCTSKLYVEHFDNLDNPEVAGNHNHDRDEHILLREDFDEELMTLAGTTFDDFKHIYDITLQKVIYAPIRTQVKYSTYQAKMRVERAKFVPPVPQTLAALADVLTEYPPVTEYYRGCARGTDGSIGLVFIHASMLEPLSRCRQLYADGTFKIRPRKPPCAQVFIVHFRKMNTGFPAIFVLASSRTTAMYNAIWDKVFEIIPNLRQNVLSLMGDFERSQINSGREKFPNATISGCLFHYKQALSKTWDDKSIPMEFEYILERAYAVAHLPPDKIPDGFMHITTLVDNLANGNAIDPAVLQKLQDFAAYLRRFWLPLANVLSVYQKPVRSNNTCENFHLYAAKAMGERSNVYKMLDGMKEQMGKISTNFEKAEAGLIVTTHRPQRLIEADLAIQRAEAEFQVGRYNVEEYLTHIASLRRYHFARVHEYNERLQRPVRRAAEVEEEEEENDEDVNVEEAQNVHFGINDVDYLRNELNPDAGPGREFENDVPVLRRRRLHYIRDAEQMPEPLAQPIVAVGRRGRPRRNANAAAAEEQPVVRRRGRPRRNQNEPNNDVVDEPAPRRRGRPRLNRNVPAEAVVDEPAPRRRGRPRRNRNVPIEQNIEEAIEEDIGEQANPEPIREADEVINDEGIEDPIREDIEAADGEGDQEPIREDIEAANEEGIGEPIEEVIPGLEVVEEAAAAVGGLAGENDEPTGPVIENHADSDIEEVIEPLVDNPIVPQKKRKLRRGGKNCFCSACYTREHLHKLPDCPHRICKVCVKKLIMRECPSCRTPITTYLPVRMMGDEAWGQNIPAQLEREFRHQVFREFVMEIEQGEIDYDE